VLKTVIDLSSGVDFLNYLTPFRYFDSLKVMYEHQLRLPYLLLSGGLAAAFTAGTYYFFHKRDIMS
jgi:hypothetical protein